MAFGGTVTAVVVVAVAMALTVIPWAWHLQPTLHVAPALGADIVNYILGSPLLFACNRSIGSSVTSAGHLTMGILSSAALSPDLLEYCKFVDDVELYYPRPGVINTTLRRLLEIPELVAVLPRYVVVLDSGLHRFPSDSRTGLFASMISYGVSAACFRSELQYKCHSKAASGRRLRATVCEHSVFPVHCDVFDMWRLDCSRSACVARSSVTTEEPCAANSVDVCSLTENCDLAINAVTNSPPSMNAVPGRRFVILRYGESERFINEVLEMIAHGLRELGHWVGNDVFPICATAGSCIALQGELHTTYILASLCDFIKFEPEKAALTPLPGSAIIVNLEVLNAAKVEACVKESAYVKYWRTHPVWDYSIGNVDVHAPHLNLVGEFGYVHLPLVHHPGSFVLPLDTILPEPVYDVIMLGSSHSRRDAVVSALLAAGVSVLHVRAESGGLWSAARDRAVRSARIVLNIHWFQEGLLETPRLIYALAQGLAVISEDSTDKILQQEYSDAVIFAPYSRVVDSVVATLANPRLLEHMKRAALQFARRASAGAVMANVLAQTREPGQWPSARVGSMNSSST